MQLATLNGQAVTMTSREIAELIEKQHSNIKISAERLSSAGVIGTLAAQEFTHNGNTYTHSSPRAHNSGTAFPEGSGPWGLFFVRVHGSTIGEPSFFAQKSACEDVRSFQNTFAAVRKGSPWNH